MGGGGDLQYFKSVIIILLGGCWWGGVDMRLTHTNMWPKYRWYSLDDVDGQVSSGHQVSVSITSSNSVQLSTESGMAGHTSRHFIQLPGAASGSGDTVDSLR